MSEVAMEAGVAGSPTERIAKLEARTDRAEQDVRDLVLKLDSHETADERRHVETMGKLDQLRADLFARLAAPKTFSLGLGEISAETAKNATLIIAAIGTMVTSVITAAITLFGGSQ